MPRGWSPGRRARPGGGAGARDRDGDPRGVRRPRGAVPGRGQRTRYRMWLEIAAGRYDVVIGTRPAVFAPVDRLGLVYVARESHPAHREDRAPYYHVRDVACARARLEDGVSSSPRCVRRRRPRRSACPRSRRPATLAAGRGRPARSRGPSAAAREGVGDGPPRIRVLPLPGAGVAQVCRTCGEPAACASCGGLLRAEAGAVACVVCGTPAACRSCGGRRSGSAAAARSTWRPGRPARPPQPFGASARTRRPAPRAGRDPRRRPDDDVRSGRATWNSSRSSTPISPIAARPRGARAEPLHVDGGRGMGAAARPRDRPVVLARRSARAGVVRNPDRFHADERRRRAEALPSAPRCSGSRAATRWK